MLEMIEAPTSIEVRDVLVSRSNMGLCTEVLSIDILDE